jgi:hypothetical protein
MADGHNGSMHCKLWPATVKLMPLHAYFGRSDDGGYPSVPSLIKKALECALKSPHRYNAPMSEVGADRQLDAVAV